MSDVAGEPADRLDTLHLQQVMLALAQLTLGAGALELGGDASGKQLQERSRGGLVPQWAARDRDDGPDDLIPRSDQRQGDVAIRVERRERDIVREVHADTGVVRADRPIGGGCERRSGEDILDVVAGLAVAARRDRSQPVGAGELAHEGQLGVEHVGDFASDGRKEVLSGASQHGRGAAQDLVVAGACDVQGRKQIAGVGHRGPHDGW